MSGCQFRVHAEAICISVEQTNSRYSPTQTHTGGGSQVFWQFQFLNIALIAHTLQLCRYRATLTILEEPVAMWAAFQMHCYLVTDDYASMGRRRADLNRGSK